MTQCPIANQYGTSRGTPVQGIGILDNIHNNDWALYAGVEFGNGEYYEATDSVEFTASCGTDGGNIEVWLDSIDSGTKIADCLISNTGSWYEFKRFTAAVANMTGNHDVYVRFRVTGTSKLFMLKWMTFTRHSENVITSVEGRENERLSIYPNPAKHISAFSRPFCFIPPRYSV